VFVTSRVGSSDPTNFGVLIELDAIAAAVVGGTAVAGGRANVFVAPRRRGGGFDRCARDRRVAQSGFPCVRERTQRRRSERGAGIAIGMTMVIIAGGVDLSVGSAITLCSVVAVKLARYGLAPAALAALLVGAAIGFGNGLIVAKLRIAPFIATLASLLALRGVTIVLKSKPCPSMRAGRPSPRSAALSGWARRCRRRS
jgi:ribose/xylose/arabinose/galactoside ABC-type transport system permease subunit